MKDVLERIKLIEEESQVLKEAHVYIEKNMEKVVKQSERNHFHLSPEIGWLNDPNGFSVYNGEYHMFYQYYPYDIKWGPMHWGHAISKDLIKWEYAPVAIAPDQIYDKSGCFSGSAIQVGDKHVLIYTGHVDPNMSFNGSIASDASEIRQVQCLAIGDGITYKKAVNNPVINTEQIPPHSSLNDFRDPKIWEKDGIFYCVVGSRDRDESGKIVFYKSNDLLNWDYVGILDHSQHELGKMWECPDVFELDGHDVLIMSPQQMHEDLYKYKNGNTTVYFIGQFDYETGKFNKIKDDEIDYGLDFYAPQTTHTPDGRRIMMAWMQSWDRNIPSDKYGWAGSMTLPRELKVIGNKLYQFPVSEIENYRTNLVSHPNVTVEGKRVLSDICGRQLELNVEVELNNAKYFGIHLMKGVNEETTLALNVAKGILRFDRTNSGSGIHENKPLNMREMPIEIQDKKLKLRIFIDTYSVEVFVNDGEYAMTSTVYSNLDADGIEFEADSVVNLKVEKWKLDIK